MDIEKIKENIKKNEEKLQKNEALLQKRIEKANKLSDWLKENNIKNDEDANLFDKNTGLFDFEAYENLSFVKDWKERVGNYKDENGITHWGNERNRFESEKIDKVKEIIEKLKEKLAKEIIIQNKIENLPEALKSMAEYLNKEWTEYELNRKIELKKELETLHYKEFVKKYSCEAYSHVHKTEEQIKNEVALDVRFSILDLLNRVSETIGEVEDWDCIKWIGKALNGFLKGSKGNAKVETIMAGGYNIQRLHYRVLVHKL